MKYINADLIKELMKRSIALQGNCEYTLWLQTVDNYVENLPSIDIDSRGHETMSDKVWCSKCRYLYRDFKYGLSCYRLMDNEPCKYEYRKDEPKTQMKTQNSNLTFEKAGEPQTEQVGVPFGEMDEATFKSHCLNCQRDTADIKCLDCDGNKYFLSYGSEADCPWK